MSGIDDIYTNYDTVFKDAMDLFKDKSLDFFGLDNSLRVKEPLKTEKKELVVTSEFSDGSFLLSNNKGMHTDSQTDISKKDMLRFCGYNLYQVQTYGMEFITIIVTNRAPSITSIDYQCLKFPPQRNVL